MCRLFALRSDQPVSADFWLLDASYSLLDQSHFNDSLRARSEHPFGPLARAPGLEDLGLSAAASQAHAAQERAHADRRRHLAEAPKSAVGRDEHAA